MLYHRTRTDGAEDYEICKGPYDAFMQTGKGPKDAPIRDLAYLRRVVMLRTDPIFRSIPVSVLAIGSLTFVGLGGEPFTRYAKRIQEGAKEKFVLSLCCANGFEGYFPTRPAFEEGGYEATASPFTPELEEQCVTEALRLIGEEE